MSEPVRAYPTDCEVCVNEGNRHGSTYVLDGLSIYNCCQVKTKVNTSGNMGDRKTTVDEWLRTVIK
ncbi:hypothetical protein [uncultured Bacteroides sp.]|uniref:hypothetical protein n=1 Tax=uncultured Bacteroides sp. TaxID=162156 RepID=UPI00267667BF|nr:hypothetical protein [uncultured Bacteroides sp.]